MQPTLLHIQKFLVTHKKQILKLFYLTEIGLGVLMLVGAYFILTRPQDAFAWHQLGRRLGYIGLIFYWLTLLPGIFSRLQWFPLLGAMIMPFRRHFGILMFTCVATHQLFTTSLRVVAFDAPFRLSLTTANPRIFGILAIFVLLPLWLTSNDQSQKYLGRKWKWLHRLTYLALLLIFLHVAYFRRRWAIPTFSILLLEAYSWFDVWWRTRSKPPVSTVAPSPSTQINPPSSQK